MGRNGGDDGGAIFSTKSKRKANGCMTAFYHLFDFQHLYFPSHHNNLTIDSPSKSKGLKSIQESPPSTTYKDKQSLYIPVSMRVRTETGTTSSRLKALATDTCSSEICNSPGSKTPSLVARLMGLDLLPENHSMSNLPHHGSSRLTSHRLSKKGTRLGGTRSLPESPRVSSARKSDLDIHRLSLQLNKHEEFCCSRLKQQEQEESQSPRVYARQIVKQIKERVATRRVVGMDITKSVKNREARPLQDSSELRRDTTISCSPRTRFSNKENNPTSFRPEQITHKPKPKQKPTRAILVSGEKQNQKRVKEKELRPIKQCKKAKSETRFSQTPDIRKKQREAFLSESTDAKASNPLHRKKFKKIPKSSDLDNNFPVTKTHQKQTKENEGLKSNIKTKENGPQAATVTSSSSRGIRIDSEQVYITRMMKLAIDSPVSSATMLDPSIFSELENSGGENQLSLRCNRRLLFDLVKEILTETLKRHRKYHGSELIGELCSIVVNYRSNIGEIASAEFDRPLETKKLEEEREEIIVEIERDIIEALVRETASELNLQRRRNETTSEK